jgi:hypothetical protein
MRVGKWAAKGAKCQYRYKTQKLGYKSLRVKRLLILVPYSAITCMQKRETLRRNDLHRPLPGIRTKSPKQYID